MKRKPVKTAFVAATAFVAGMSMWTTSANAQMADMCALVAHEMCVDSVEFQSYEICYNFYYRQYCPDWSEPNCLTDPVTGRTICV